MHIEKVSWSKVALLTCLTAGRSWLGGLGAPPRDFSCKLSQAHTLGGLGDHVKLESANPDVPASIYYYLFANQVTQIIPESVWEGTVPSMAGVRPFANYLP